MPGLASQFDRTAPDTLKASATLPAAGAWESDPAIGNMVSFGPTKRKATITISYTRGGAGGRASHKVFFGDGTRVGQVPSSDDTFDGDPGRASTSASAIVYSFSIDLSGGNTSLGIASAEIGTTGTPGTYVATVTFQ